MGSQTATTLTLTAGPVGTSSFGQAVTLTGSLNPFLIGNNSSNGELVTFKSGGPTLGTGALLNGIATYTTTATQLPIGADMLTASCGGDTGLQTSASSPLSYTVGKAAAVVQPSISTGASIPYGPYSVNATVAGVAAGLPVPTGSVSYVINGGALISGALVNGSITFQLPQTPVGVHTIGFAYSGDSNYAGTPNNVVPTSLYIPFTITPATLTVTANSLTGVYGQPLPTLTDTITGFVFPTRRRRQ
jgi:hypothetical protein